VDVDLSEGADARRPRAIDVPDLDAALALASKMPNIEYGSVEVRPVMVFPQSG